MYSQNIFDVPQPRRVLLLSYTILPQRLHAIQSLQLYWDLGRLDYMDTIEEWPPPSEYTWETTWEIIAAMKGLKQLKVVIEDRGGRHQEQLAKLLAHCGLSRV